MDQVPHVLAGAAGALAAASGTGAATEFGKRLTAAGSEWLRERFGKSAQAAVEAAQVQGGAFIAELEQRVNLLEQKRVIAPGEADSAFQRPDTLSALRLGYNAASETADALKRSVLASLVADRLKAAAESTEAATSRRAIEIAANVSPAQFRLLAQLVLVRGIRPTGVSPAAIWPWLEARLAKVSPIVTSFPAVAYLESLALVKYEASMVADLSAVLGRPAESIRSTPTGAALFDAWATVWQHVDLTLVGQYLGVYAYDELSSEHTSVDGLF